MGVFRSVGLLTVAAQRPLNRQVIPTTGGGASPAPPRPISCPEAPPSHSGKTCTPGTRIQDRTFDGTTSRPMCADADGMSYAQTDPAPPRADE